MSEPSFESQLEQLEALVTRLEQGDVPLAEALEAFEKGMQLSKTCSEMLKAAEQRVSELTQE
ncbi:MAG: exodeoxyribonuclease VII small subunit [Litorivicinus sp.]